MGLPISGVPSFGRASALMLRNGPRETLSVVARAAAITREWYVRDP